MKAIISSCDLPGHLIRGIVIAVLPVMLSSKLLPEMEIDDNSKKDQLLHGLQNLPVAVQIEKLKVILDQLEPLFYRIYTIPFILLFMCEVLYPCRLE